MDDAHKNNISMALKGKPKTKDHKEKISKAKKGKFLGSNNPNFKGRTYRGGYIFIYKPNHLFSSNRGYIPEHRYIMEQFLGFTFLPCQDVHHINSIKDDNRIENLEVVCHHKHAINHLTGKKLSKETNIKKSNSMKKHWNKMKGVV